MDFESLLARFGARKDETRSGYNFACAKCEAPVYRTAGDVAAILPRRARRTRVMPWGDGFFCSHDCRRQHVSAAMPALACETCGEQAIKLPSHARWGNRRFCSTDCYHKRKDGEASCCWPGCGEQVALRVTASGLYRVRGRQHGVKRALCASHDKTLRTAFGNAWGVTGRCRWFDDPSTEYQVRGLVSKIARLLVHSKTDGHCAICRTSLELYPRPATWHIDHIEPVAAGGRSDYWNLQPLCIPCHRTKSAADTSAQQVERHSGQRTGRWLTHHQKDQIISDLRSEVAELRRLLGRTPIH